MLASIPARVAGAVADDITDATDTRDVAPGTGPETGPGTGVASVDPAAPTGGTILGWAPASDLDWLEAGAGTSGPDTGPALPAGAGAAGPGTGPMDALRAEAVAAIPDAAPDDDSGGFVPMACSCAFCGESTSSAAISPFVGRAGGYTLADGTALDPWAPGDAGGPGLAEMLTDIDPRALIQFSGDRNVDATIFGSKWSITDLTFCSRPTAPSTAAPPTRTARRRPGDFQAFNAAQQTMARYALTSSRSIRPHLHRDHRDRDDPRHAALRADLDGDVPSAYANFPGA